MSAIIDARTQPLALGAGLRTERNPKTMLRKMRCIMRLFGGAVAGLARAEGAMED